MKAEPSMISERKISAKESFKEVQKEEKNEVQRNLLNQLNGNCYQELSLLQY